MGDIGVLVLVFNVLLWFWYQDNINFIKFVGNVSATSIYWKYIFKFILFICKIFSKLHQWNHVELEFSLNLITNSISFIDIKLFGLSFFPLMSFGNFCLSRNLFYLNCLNLLILLLLIFSCYPFNIFMICLENPSSISFIVDLILIFCFPRSLLLIFSKDHFWLC